MDLRTSQQSLLPRPRSGEPQPGAVVREPASEGGVSTSLPVVDLALGVCVTAARLGRRSTSLGGRLLAPATPVLRWAAQPLLDSGRQQRLAAVAVLSEAWRAVLPRVLDAVLDQVDLTDLVLDRVDLDAVVSRVDLDAAVSRADLDAAVSRVDLGRIIDRLPIDQVLARIDLDAVAATIDVDAIVDRLDLIALARYVIDGVDLPEIIRESTGSMASESIREVRMRSIEADERVSRLVDRALLRRHGRRTDAPSQPGREDGETP